MQKENMGPHIYLFTFLCLGLCFFAGSRQRKTEQAIAVNGVATAPVVALTFDDGPDPVYTEELLEGLRQREVRATFFLLGQQVARYPKVVEKIHANGHLIGNHGYQHVDLNKLRIEEAIRQVEQTNAILYEISGEEPRYIRPPYGSLKPELDQKTRMIEVLWDIDPLDWATKDAAAVTARVCRCVKDGDIILLHDSSESSVQAACAIIDSLQAKGYRFVTIEELIEGY